MHYRVLYDLSITGYKILTIDAFEIVEVRNEEFFSLQSPQPQQVFGLRVGKSADYRIQVCNAFQQIHRRLDRGLRIIASWLNPSFSPIEYGAT
jgi:hypothetical protein